jgi:hypothetical protein
VSIDNSNNLHFILGPNNFGSGRIDHEKFNKAKKAVFGSGYAVAGCGVFLVLRRRVCDRKKLLGAVGGVGSGEYDIYGTV